MKRFVAGADQGQSTLPPECLDDWIDEDDPVRVVDAFVDGLDLSVSGSRRRAGGDGTTRLPPLGALEALHLRLSQPRADRVTLRSERKRRRRACRKGAVEIRWAWTNPRAL